MNLRGMIVGPAIAICVAAGPALAAAPPASWDGLVRVDSKRLDLVYLQPGADFRGYTKVMLDPTEVAFEKNWRRDYNDTVRDLSSKVSEKDVQKAITAGVAAAGDLFAEAAKKGGYEVVTEPGPDVLRLRTAILNIRVVAPERNTAGRSHTFSSEGGQATLVVEVRDSETGALLGRAVDGKVVGDQSMATWRTSVSNRADFRRVVRRWADASIQGLDVLKAASPVN